MASEVSICNQALGWVGGNRIVSLDDGTQEANLCQANYADLRDALLEADNWVFALARGQWPEDASAPLFGYSKSYSFPNYALRVVHVDTASNTDIDWKVEGRKILTDYADIRIIYVRRITDPNVMPPLFRQALAARLAAELAIPLTKSRSLQQDMFTLFDVKYTEAINADNRQGVQKKIISDRFTRVR